MEKTKNQYSFPPKEVKQYLDLHVLGQEKAKIAAAVLLHSHAERHIRQNLWFVGPSGCGKTEIFRRLQDIAPPHTIYIYDASNITSDGWKGNKKYDSVFKEMYHGGWSKEEIEHAIIVFDEFDKLVDPHISSSGENVSASVQGELLAMVEGTALTVHLSEYDSKQLETYNISFVFLGAFETLRKNKAKEIGKGILGFGQDYSSQQQTPEVIIEDLVQYGLRAELAGRTPRVFELDALTENDFLTILMDPIQSPVAKLAIQYKQTIQVDQQALKDLAKAAAGNDMGVRYMYGKILDAISRELYEPGSSKFLTLTELYSERLKGREPVASQATSLEQER